MFRAWMLAAAFAACALGPAAAQQGQQQQDPFGGRFGSVQLAMQPREAARNAELMGQALAGLQPQRPGQLDVYLVVASLWSEPVFEREASQAEAILRQHLGAEGRSILLSAGQGVSVIGPRAYPAANPDNIAAALGRIGQIADLNEDLVVVFFTSHGSPDGSMAMLEQQRLQGALRPVNLRDMFTEAGIRNRVVIISACFSGAFLAPLMNDDTIVMSAAASDRTSFGCQPTRDWTYFGDAYFNHAVRGGANLVPAFDQAKVLITQWEHDNNMTPPSNPQRFVGSHAAQMLAQAERAATSTH